jgi:hypothetical protein
MRLFPDGAAPGPDRPTGDSTGLTGADRPAIDTGKWEVTMCVLVEGISVIVRISTIEEKYPRGLEGYYLFRPNATFCADDHLVRVGFMMPDDVGIFVGHLEEMGLRFVDEDGFVDIAVVDQVTGPTTRCEWLEAGRHPGGYAAAWLTGTEPGALAAPWGWRLEESLSTDFRIVSMDRLAAEIEVARDVDGRKVYRNLETGRQVYIGSPFELQDSRQVN